MTILIDKISKSIGILFRSRNYLTKSILKQLYYSFINSYLTYGNLAWGSSPKTNLNALLLKQKQALRTINFVSLVKKDQLGNIIGYTETRPLFLQSPS